MADFIAYLYSVRYFTPPGSAQNGRALFGTRGCASCHRARRMPKDEVRARNIPTDSWGAHHGPQADMLAGTNAYEFPGKKYASSVHMALPNANCVTCHMSLPSGRYSLAPSVGGHSFRIAGEVHEEHKVNTAGCTNSGCHATMTQVKGTHYFDKASAQDFDGDGKVETAQEEVQGLLERFVNDKGSGLLQTMKGVRRQRQVVNTKTQYPVETVAALYNHKFVLEDRGRRVQYDLLGDFDGPVKALTKIRRFERP
jgi:cytochrome c2